MTDEALDDAPLFDDDPVLGAYIAHYPGNRLRLLIIGGMVLVVVYFVLTVLLWRVEETTAFIITFVTLALVTLGVGWYASHLWNREVVLYDKGFSYREGSTMAYIPYNEVVSFRQSGQVISYFGGLIRRNTLQFRLATKEDETILLNNLYRNLSQLGERLEAHIAQAQVNRVQASLDAGEHVPFGEGLELSAVGLHNHADTLRWEAFGGYRIGDGHLTIVDEHTGENWLRTPLAEVDHIRVLIYLLRQRQPQSE